MEKDADIMKRRFWNLDALRFVFAVLIVYYHVVGGYIQPFVGGDAYYLQMAANSRKMCMVAHIFFVISGFFLLKSIKRLLGGGIRLQTSPVIKYLGCGQLCFFHC